MQMHHVSPSRLVKRNELLERGFNAQMNVNRAKNCFQYCIFSSIIFLICAYEITHVSQSSCYDWYYVEYGVGVFSAFATIAYFLRYLWFFFHIEKVKVTEDQKRFLHLIEDDDVSFSVINPNESKASDDNSFNQRNSSRNYDIITPNWTWNWNFNHNTFGSFQGNNLGPNRSWSASFKNSTARSESFISPYQTYNEKDLITSEKSLEKFLNDVSINSDSSPTSDSYYVQESLKTVSSNSFWGYYNSAANLLRTSLYQLSPQTDSTQNIMNDKNEYLKDESNFIGVNHISCEKLAHYVGNLRMWLSLTILKRITVELEKIDEVYSSRGFSDTQIGSIGLERLKKSVENQQFVAQHVPLLPKLIPFLEISTNQQHLVQRIKDLAQGSCLSNYRWSHNTSLHYGIYRDENNPTDAAIMFHLFCTYLDSQLMPLPQPGGRPFFNRYIVIGDNRNEKEIVAAVKNKAKCAILCSNLLKPNFNFICDNTVHTCVYNRNNLFNVIIHFLKYIKDTQNGLLEGVYLGESGINILCVLRD